MKTKQLLVLSAAAMVLTACSSKLGELSADNFTVTPNPLESQAGQVTATINGAFPQKYMKKKAVVTVTPEMRYQSVNGLRTIWGQSATFQGEKVLGNNQTISYQNGGRYTMRTNFDYVPEMEQSEMWMHFDAKVGKKTVEIPSVKVADGVVSTSELYKRTLTSAQPALAQDAFQRIISQKQEANIQFLVNQANLRSSELKNNSVQEFLRLLGEIANDQEGLRLNGVDISAYASPEGSFDFNDKLAGRRQNAAAGYVQQQMKKANVSAPLDTHYTAEDWDGFQQLVAASNIQDKDVILRVLSMYQDPEERERQIRNISAGYAELTDAILPQLRRARMTVNYDVVGRDDQQIKDQLQSDASQLSVEELLYAGSLYAGDYSNAEKAYKKATELYPNDARAYNNMALVEYAKGNYDAAKSWLQKAAATGSVLPETNANLGLIALQQGDVQAAEQLIAKGSNANGINEVMGNLHLAQGKYAQAVQDFAGLRTNSAALAQLLNKDYQAAAQTLKSIKNADATTDYLRAIVNARTGNNSAAAQALAAAVAKDPTLASYAAKDLELVNVSK